MATRCVKSFGLPLVLLLATLPGAVLSFLADVLRQQFVAVAAVPSRAPTLPHWLAVPFSLYYVAGILLGLIALTCVDTLFRFSRLWCRAYVSLRGRTLGRVTYGAIFGGAFGVGWLTLSHFTGIGSGFIVVGFGPAIAVGWWLKHRGHWPAVDRP